MVTTHHESDTISQLGSANAAPHRQPPKKQFLIRLFILDRTAHDLSPLDAVRGHRAVGVVYNPEREQFGNYVPTILPRRYDAFIFIDETRALQPVS